MSFDISRLKNLEVNKYSKPYEEDRTKLPMNNTQNVNLPVTNQNKFLQFNEFNNTNQNPFLSLAKTVTGTGTDILQDVAKGFISPIENVADVGVNALASVQDLMRFKNEAQDVRNFANRDLSGTISKRAAQSTLPGVAYNLFNGTPQNIINNAGVEIDTNKSFGENVGNAFNKIFNNDDTSNIEGYEKSSILGEYPDKLNELIGYTFGLSTYGNVLGGLGKTAQIGSESLGASANLGNIGINIAGHTLNVPTLALAGGMAGGLQEANSKENVSEFERWGKALSSGAIEGVTEGIFGLMGIGGSDITDKFASKLAGKFSSSAGKMLSKLGVQASGEATEEFLSYVANYFVDNGLINKLGDANFENKWDWKELGEQMALAFVSAGISGGSTTVLGNNAATKSAEQQLGRPLTMQERAQITQAVIDENVNERINNLKNENQLNSPIANQNVPLNQTQNAQQQVQQQTTLPEQKMVQNQTSEQIQQNNKNVAKNITSEDNLITSAKKYGYDFNNNNLIEMQQALDRRGIKGQFNEQYFIDKNGNIDKNTGALWNIATDENGNVTRSIILNPNANKSTLIQEMEIHELLHDIIAGKTQASQDLYNDVLDFMQQDTGYEKVRTELEDLYAQRYDRNSKDFQQIIDEEVVAKALQTKLGNQEEISRLVKYNPTKARSLYDKVVAKVNELFQKYNGDNKLLNKAKDYIFWKNVQNNFEYAYSQEGNYENTNANNRYFIETVEQFSQMRYNNATDISDQINYKERGILRHMIADDSNVKPGLNKIYTTNAEYLVYLKDKNDYKILSRKVDNDAGKLTERNPYTRGMQDSSSISKRSINDTIATESNDGISNINQTRESERVRNNRSSQRNNENVENSNKGSFNLPQNVKEISNLNKFIDKAIQNESDPYWLSQLKEASAANYVDWTRRESRLHWKRGLIQQYLDYKNQSNKISNTKYSINNLGEMQDSKGKKVTLDGETGSSDKTLLAIHNLNEEKLQGVLNLGGFPVPSIAITNPNIINHDQFGDISVIFNKDTINPANKANEVYDRDVWSPVVPEINYDVNSENIKRYITNNLTLDRKDSIVNDAVTRYMYDSNLGDIINRYGEKRTLEILKDSKELQYLYKKSVEDPNYKPKMKSNEFSRYHTNETLQRFIDKFNKTHDMSLSDFFYHYINYSDMELSQEERAEIDNQIKEAIRPELEEYYKKYNNSVENRATQEQINKAIQEELDNETEIYGRFYDFLYNASQLDQNGIYEVIDEQRTLENISNDINKENYDKWVDNTFGKLFKETTKGIRNDKDVFTPSGNRRKFNQLYDEYNLENLVNKLTKGNTRAGQKTLFEGGFGKTSAELSTKFNSIQDIKNNQNKIKSSEELAPIIEEIKDKFNSDLHKLEPYRKNKSSYSNEFAVAMETFENIQSAVEEFASKGNLTPERFRKVLDSYYVFDTKSIPNEVLNTIIDDLNEMKNLPTDYFEAKPQRAVGFDEIDAIVIPSDTSAELKQQLKDKGIKTIEYDRNNENEKADIIKSLDEYKFSKETNFDDYLEKRIGKTGTRTSLGELKLPTQETMKASMQQQESVQTPKQTKTEPVLLMTENQKFRKHYESIIQSENTTPEAKKIAKELMGLDTYEPDSNNNQLERADNFINKEGIDKALQRLVDHVETDSVAYDGVFRRVGVDDVALGERLIQYYSKIGDATNLQLAIQATAAAGTDAGRAVQAFSILNHQTPQGQVTWIQRSVDKMNKELKQKRGEKAQQFDFTPEMQQKILNADTQEEMYNAIDEVYEELGQQVSKTLTGKIDSWRYFSMLANPKTHIRNIVGNIAMGKVQSAKNKIAGAIEGVVSKFNPEMERTHTIVPASKEVKQFAKNDLKNLEVQTGLEMNENKYTPMSRLENSMRTFKSNGLENTIGKLFDFNNKALEVEDAWGLKSAYVKSLSEYMTANKLTPDNITDKQLSKARKYAIEQAKEATFHQASALATAVNQFSKKNGLTKFATDAVVPFKKTPINVAKAGLEYSPVGLTKSVIYDTIQLNKGNISVNKYIDNISKGLTGTGIALLGYALAEAGILKASGGDDDKEKYDQDRGMQTYSIQIGDNTYSLDWLAPVGIPLFIGAEVHNIMKKDEETKTSTSSDDDKAYNQAIKSATNILDAFTNAMNPMTEMSMLSGLTSALKSYDGDNAKMLANLGVNTSKSYVNQFVPTALGQVAKTTDEYERSTTSTQTGTLPKAIDSTKNQIMAKIPGLRQMLPTKTDVWGNDLKQSENVVQRALENAVLPFVRKEIQNSEVDKELTRLYDSTGESGILPDSINKNLTINKEKYVMTSDEYAKYKKQYGQTAYDLIDNLVTSKDYKNMTDEQKTTAIENIYKYANEQIKDDYAKENNLDYELSTMSNVANKLNKSDKDDYFEFTAKTKDLNKDSEKLQVLADSNYSNKAKETIYENSLGKNDNLYDTMKLAGIDINEYLNYKTQEFTSDKEDDGTTTGKSVSGSKKAKVVDYVQNMNIPYNQKLLLLATQYSLTTSEKSKVANYVNSLKTTKANKLKIYESLSGFTVYKDGRVTW